MFLSRPTSLENLGKIAAPVTIWVFPLSAHWRLGLGLKEVRSLLDETAIRRRENLIKGAGAVAGPAHLPPSLQAEFMLKKSLSRRLISEGQPPDMSLLNRGRQDS